MLDTVLEVFVRDDAVTLTRHEIAICRKVGEWRYEHALSIGRGGGLGPSRRNDGPHLHVRGAKCEYAASIILNLYWRPTVGQIDQRDVGGLVEVRSTVLQSGRLIIKPADDEDAPHVLIVTDDGAGHEFGGWCYGWEAKHRGTLVRDHGDPAYFVPRARLRHIDELREELAGRRP